MEKIIILCALLVIFSTPVRPALSKADYGKELLALSKILHNTCIKKSGTTQEAIDKVEAGQFSDDPTMKKYIACAWIETTLVDKNGKLNMDMLTQLSPPKLKATLPSSVNGCWDKSAAITPLEERVFDMVKCVYNNDPENFFFF